VKSREIAHRYAVALYRLAREQGCVKELEAEYRGLLDEIDGVPDLTRFLAHPLVPALQKVETVDRAFPAISQDLRNLLYLLIRNGREDYLGLIFGEFLDVRSRGEGTARVGVVAARRLGEDEKKELGERLARVLGRPVELEERIDPDLIGGLKIEVGGKVVDATLRAKLEGLKRLLQG
jgi:F-type H+-transporting ATPase subunit delta